MRTWWKSSATLRASCIICSFNQDIYQIADMIARQKDVTVLYVKDYIRKPKPNGYKSYHMVVTTPFI